MRLYWNIWNQLHEMKMIDGQSQCRSCRLGERLHLLTCFCMLQISDTAGFPHFADANDAKGLKEKLASSNQSPIQKASRASGLNRSSSSLCLLSQGVDQNATSLFISTLRISHHTTSPCLGLKVAIQQALNLLDVTTNSSMNSQHVRS